MPKKVLFIIQEMAPFDQETQKSLVGRYLPQYIQDLRNEIRIFTPKWGDINERRNQLHEVIRLSGMNLIIDETDHPLIIKVASLAAARMQIYFIDNDDYFMKRKKICDENGVEYDDNGERAIFYARGVLETVKKLRWVPDVVHVHGWISALAPLYIKKAFAEEPSFRDCKVVTSVSSPEFTKDLGKHAKECIPFKEAKATDIELLKDSFSYNDLMKLAVKYSDGVILDTPDVDASVVEYAKELGIPVLDYLPLEETKEAYNEFYDQILAK